MPVKTFSLFLVRIFQETESNILDAEPLVGKGVGAALFLASKKGNQFRRQSEKARHNLYNPFQYLAMLFRPFFYVQYFAWFSII